MLLFQVVGWSVREFAFARARMYEGQFLTHNSNYNII